MPEQLTLPGVPELTDAEKRQAALLEFADTLQSSKELLEKIDRSMHQIAQRIVRIETKLSAFIETFDD